MTSRYEAIEPMLSAWSLRQTLGWITNYQDEEVRAYFLNYRSRHRVQVWIDPPETNRPILVNVFQAEFGHRPRRIRSLSCEVTTLSQTLDKALQLALEWADDDPMPRQWLGREFVIDGGDGDQQILTEPQVLVATEAPWFHNRTYHSMGRIVFLFKIRGGRWDSQYMAISSRGPLDSPDQKLPPHLQLDILSRTLVVFELIRNADASFDPANPYHANAFAMGAMKPKDASEDWQACPHNAPA